MLSSLEEVKSPGLPKLHRRNSSFFDLLDPNSVLDESIKHDDPAAEVPTTASQSTDRLSSIQENYVEENMFEVDLDIPDNVMNDIGSVISTNNKKVQSLLTDIHRKQRKIERTMSKSTFWRMVDKLGFLLGTAMICAFCVILGRFPHDGIYTYVSVLLPILLAGRYIDYYIKGWHMYCIDWCYWVNFTLLYYLVWDPKNETLCKILFLFT